MLSGDTGKLDVVAVLTAVVVVAIPVWATTSFATRWGKPVVTPASSLEIPSEVDEAIATTVASVVEFASES